MLSRTNHSSVLSRRRVPPAVARPSLRYFSAADSPEEQAVAFVEERGYSPELARGVVSALMDPTSGIPKTALLATVKTLAGRWEIGEDMGLAAIAQSVQAKLNETAGLAKVKFQVEVPHGGHVFECEGFEGLSVAEVAEQAEGPGGALLAEFLECACSQVMACSTCHVIVSPEWFGRVGEPSESELDMIELAYDPQNTSRLGCQLKLRPELDGMLLHLPKGANNMMDDIPFDDRSAR